MPARHLCLLFSFLVSPAILFRAHGQTAGQPPPPGCGASYYHGGYGPPLDGDVSLESMVVGPDASIYLGCLSYPYAYSIMKLDSFGNIIRTTAYTAGGSGSYTTGKTIVDADGNLFSVIFNNHLLRTDTIGNVLSARTLSLIGGTQFSFTDVAVLANGDKAFLVEYNYGTSPSQFLVVTSPDASVIRWTKYFYAYTYSYNYAGIMTDGNKIILGVDFFDSYSYNAPDNSGIIALDGTTGAVLHQRWFPQQLNFRQISRYNNGYVFSGTTPAPNTTSFYMRTDTSLDPIAAYDFPSYTTGYPFLFRTQPDGSIYGFYSNTSTLDLFLISPGDAIEWASGAFGFYQNPVSMVLDPSGIFMGTDWGATDVITGGPLSGMELYKSSYSGYFPPCTQPQSATMKMTSFVLGQAPETVPLRDTTAFITSNDAIGRTTAPTLVGYTCSGAPDCNSLTIAGSPNICTGAGTFTGNLNAGCSLGITWSVTDGPAAATIQPAGNNTTSIQFPRSGTYKVKALVNTNCSDFGDSLIVHVNTATTLSLGSDTVLCAGNSLLLHAGNEYNSYTWQDGSADSTFLVTTPGQYTVRVGDYCGNFDNSSVNVSYRPPLTSPFPANITKCASDTLRLPFPSGFDSVYFVMQEADARLANNSVEFYDTVATDYVLGERDDHGCTVNSPIRVQVYPQPTLFIGNDTTVCPGDSVRLDAGAGFSTYQWNTGSQNQAIWAPGNGTYWVNAATASGCFVRDSMTLTNYPAPVVHLDPDSLLCAGTTRTFFAGNGYAAYQWNDGSTAASLTVGSPGQYWVNVTNVQGCSTADTVTITAIAPCLTGVFIPNAFTPNNDGKDDVFRPLIYGNVTHYHFAVFNRWGQQVFESGQLMQGWDGTVRGTPQPAGGYVWTCEYQLQGAPIQLQRGFVLLLR